ncbi:TPM domain-containing protein [Carnobacterium sp.]|uniref:TPM domain-containing protein n=1 Tax=Carnobacterium sp. TaxID=48221 RepID=UPI0028AAC2B6|nr:TPM domain-containing protein [Carnobacterium sp.]
MSIKKSWYRIAVVFGLLASFLFLPAPSATAADLPEATSDFYVYDETGMLTLETKELIMKINNYYEQTDEKPQIVVAVVNSLAGETIEQFSVDLFEKWKIGNPAYDNGVLILLALDEREIRFEIGYGLEGVLTDGKTGRILDNNLTYLSDNQYNDGVKHIFMDTAVEVDKEYHYEDTTALTLSNPNLVSQPDKKTWTSFYLGNQFSSIIRFFKQKLNSIDIPIFLGCIVVAIFTSGLGGSGGSGGSGSGSSRGSSSRGNSRKSSGGGGRSGGGGSSRKF